VSDRLQGAFDLSAYAVEGFLGVLFLAPFTRPLERFLIRRVTLVAKPIEQPRYLYPGALETSASAINALRKEDGRLCRRIPSCVSPAIGFGVRSPVS
jgi:hypothetical protein